MELKSAKEVVDFWFGDIERLQKDKEYALERNGKWWGFGPTDQNFIDTQIASKSLITKAANGELEGPAWGGPQGTLAKLLLLDQFPRTVYRGTKEAFATDECAAQLALDIISNGWDREGKEYTNTERTFVYVPLMHSEKLEAQEKCVEKCRELYEEEKAHGRDNPMQLQMAEQHIGVVRKFGRFPHRNAPLGRESSTEEEEWLKSNDVPEWAKSQSTPSS